MTIICTTPTVLICTVVISKSVAELQLTVSEFSKTILNIDRNASRRHDMLLLGVVVQEILRWTDCRDCSAYAEVWWRIQNHFRRGHDVDNSVSEVSGTHKIPSSSENLRLSRSHPHFRNKWYHAIPEGYEFPSTSTKDLWHLNMTKKIAPFLHVVNTKIDVNEVCSRTKYLTCEVKRQNHISVTIRNLLAHVSI